MNVEKISFNVDTLYTQLEEQVPIESAIPLPQGQIGRASCRERV